MSPVMGATGTSDIAWLPERILSDGLSVRFQVQLHKVLWGDKRGV